MNIYVGNLAPAVTEEALKALFEQFGKVDSVKIIKDKFTQSSRGFAFVDMSNDQEAQMAIDKLNGQTMEGQSQPLRVNKARTAEGGFRPSGGGSRFGGGGDRRGGAPRSGGRSHSGGNGGGWGWNR